MKLRFVEGAGLSSRLISWWDNGYGGYSHVEAILREGSLCGARFDAIGGKPPGVQIRPALYERWVRRCVVTLPSARDADWEAYLRSQEGEQYDTGSIVGLITGRQLSHHGQWICSALQTEALEVVGRLPQLPTPPQQITPNSLLIAVCAVGGVVSSRL